MITSDLLSFLREIVSLCEKIDTTIVKHSSKNSSDEDFFVYHFFHRSFLFGKGLILMVDNQFFHEAALISRNMLEGLFYFHAYRYQIVSELPKKWRLYGLYEDYWMTKEEERQKLLNDYRNELGSEIVEEVQKEYKFEKKIQNWFNLQSRYKLAKEIDKRLREDLGYDIGMGSLYDTLYHDFSQISHWTPRGIIIGELNINAALAVSFQCLYTMSKYINDKYQLRFDNELKKILSGYRATTFVHRIAQGIKELK